MPRLTSHSALETLRQEIKSSRDPNKPCIAVSSGTCGLPQGSEAVFEAFKEEIERQGLESEVDLRKTGCLGFCEQVTLVVVYPEGIFYTHVKPEDVAEVVHGVEEKKIVERLLYTDRVTGERISHEFDIPFYKSQQRIVLGPNPWIDPESIEDYLHIGGYTALPKALFEMAPEEIVDEVTRSGLRGRGGGGFPAGVKWRTCREAGGAERFVICNADEGDPGAYMDRSVLESNPHAILEGMIIGAYAIGANLGFVYIRNEYPLAVRRLTHAIKQAEEYGLLGRDILGKKGFNLSLKIMRGGGAFVCGESTALMASLEGRVGMPRAKYIHTVEHGLWNLPSCLNNVETWANVPLIIDRGADWYTTIGTGDVSENPWGGSKGTKIFSLVGNVNNTGLVEVPMGTTLREIIFQIGGGIPGSKDFKAVQTGGPSGGCIPKDLLHLEVDFDSLSEVGSMMGSGGMIVMDEDTCMVDVARYFIDFLKDESCGKCVPCREGIKRMLEILERICRGEGRDGDVQQLEDISAGMKDAALCALGTSAPNPVLSTIRYFRDEYEEHIKHKKCPAAVCRKIVSSACQHTCPLEMDVPVYIALIAKGLFAEAAEVIREKNPLPSICSRVCHRPCEAKCAAGQFGDAIPINDLKRFATDYERENGNGSKTVVKKPQPQYEKVAVIGSGPAGLTAAHDLAKAGYAVTVFEALPTAGGMLAVGIPEYRLPRDILDYDIGKILALGIELKTNTRIGDDLTLDDLRSQGYKAILVAVGLHDGKPLKIEGVDREGVLQGVQFLEDVALGKPTTVGNRVVVIGGGNVGIDCARSALRTGAQDVHMVFLEALDAMLAHPWDIKEALDEGIVFHPDRGPKRILEKNGRIAGLETLECVSIFDDDGKFNPVLQAGTESFIDADTIIIAIGQVADWSFMGDGIAAARSPEGTLLADRETLMTDIPGVFAAGDIFHGPATVTGAMATGRVAASSIHRYLRGVSLEREYKVTRPIRREEPLELADEEAQRIAELGRCRVPESPVENRRSSFDEVRGCITADVAIEQAKRCLRCDLEVFQGETS
jgi:NADH-quinone oxidoreductase subunit F